MKPNYWLISVLAPGLLIMALATMAILLWGPQRTLARQDARAVSLLAQGQEAAALAIWRDLHQKYPHDVNLANRLAIVQTQMGHYASAEKLLRDLTATATDEPQAYFNLALLQLRCQQSEAAEQSLLKLLKVADWYPEAHYHLGYIYEQSGQHARARRCYVQELNVNSGCAKAWQRLLRLQRAAAPSASASARAPH